jgi:hypothetical protein
LRKNNATVTPKGEGLSIQADAHYVEWVCAFGVRTHILEADGHVCLILTMSAPDGKLRIDGQIDCFDVNPIFLGAMKSDQLKDYLHQKSAEMLKELIRKANDLITPAQILYADGLQVASANFYGAGSNQLGAKISATAVMNGTQFFNFMSAASNIGNADE